MDSDTRYRDTTQCLNIAGFGPREIFALAHVLLAAFFLPSQFETIPMIFQMVLVAGSMVYIGSHYALARLPRGIVACHCGHTFVTDALFCPLCGRHRPPEEKHVGSRRPLAEEAYLPSVVVVMMSAAYLAYQHSGHLPWTERPFKIGSLILGWYALGASLDRSLLALLLNAPPTSEIVMIFRRRVVDYWDSAPSRASLFAYLVAALISVLAARSEGLLLHNIFGVALSIHAIETISLGSFCSAFVVLGSIFAYECYIHVSSEPRHVAHHPPSNLQGPLYIAFQGAEEVSRLRMGDIVLPGIFVAMCLRFDASQFKATGGIMRIGPFGFFKKTLFWPTFIYMLAGMSMTSIIMETMGYKITPVLYSAPLTMFGALFMAWIQGNLGALLKHDEEQH